MRHTTTFAIVLACLAAAAFGVPAVAQVQPQQTEQIRQAAPDRPRVPPKRPRTVLIWNTPPALMDKDPHKGYCIPFGECAMKTLGEKTGAFRPVVSGDLAMYLPENLKRFDAVVMNNSSGAWIRPTDQDMEKLKAYGPDKAAVEQLLRRSLLDYVNGGGGIVACHFAIGANGHWPEFQEMLGAKFTGHPWNEDVGVKLDEPGHPLLAAFGGKDFRLADEIYEFGDPYSRNKLRVLLSLDTKRTNMNVQGIHRKDGDFAQAWVKPYGKGRVFYCGFGHRTEIWWNPTVLQLYLDAIQFATGDLEAPTAPRTDVAPRLQAAPPEARVPVWTRWEQALKSSKAYKDPFADVTLSVRYQGPGNQSIAGFGFWDGDATFKIRCMFPRPGKWTWQTTCSDPADTGLHQREGVVEVVPYRGENPLYRKGYLRVEPGRRYLSHADGSPFLWIGDTAWAAPMNASFADWQTYVADRRDKRFTVVQIFCASEWAGKKDVLGNPPFQGEGLSRWNPPYWQEYEKKVRYANQQGLVVTIMGLMEPVQRYPDVASAQRFARNLAARLRGDFVIFSPSFDSRYMSLGDAVADSVREAAPLKLITQHPGTDLEAARTYHGKSVLDFCGLQSGAGWGSTPLSPATASRNAIEWTLLLYRLQPPRPVVNLEARYDSAFNQEQLPRMPRSCGYLTLLSGAAGYTYGCAGVWNWGQSFVGKDPQASAWEWRQGLKQSSSVEMKLMAEFFGGLDWWRLEPCHELIRSQPEDWLRRMVMAKTATGDLAVAYLPDNPAIAINLQSFPTIMRIRWFNPKTGQQVAKNETAANSAETTLTRPTGWEDALLVLSAVE